MTLKAFATVSLFTALGVSNVSAQTGPALKAHIPFAFHVGKQTLPAGEYRLTQNVLNGAVFVDGDAPGTRLFVLTNTCQNVGPATEGKLEFHRYGATYFLSRIWMSGYTQGRELPPSAAERETARASSFELASVRAQQR